MFSEHSSNRWQDLENCCPFIGCRNQIKIQLKFNSPHNFLRGGSAWPAVRQSQLLPPPWHTSPSAWSPPEVSCPFSFLQRPSVGGICSWKKGHSLGQDERRLEAAGWYQRRPPSSSPWGLHGNRGKAARHSSYVTRARLLRGAGPQTLRPTTPSAMLTLTFLRSATLPGIVGIQWRVHVSGQEVFYSTNPWMSERRNEVIF